MIDSIYIKKKNKNKKRKRKEKKKTNIKKGKEYVS